ncbi:MAG: hypothetical protein JWO80_2687 [Bryobacterales bacterium]|nr:hypothetical protein [Bryobacterales bacterium]
MRLLQQSMALLLSWCLLLVGVRDGFAYQTSGSISQPQSEAAQQPQTGQAPQAMQQSSDQLQQLVAPIALYPDTLIAQILPAATYPSEVVEAGQWMEKHKDLKGDKLAKEVDKQSWDASVKALTQFPAVLANMNQNLAWTSELGDAYVNQQQAVNQAIQTMRQRAQKAGNLKNTSQEKVSTQGQAIVIQPAAPEVVYVPQYDPWLVYGTPLAMFPGWYPFPGLFLSGPGIGFGLGFGVGLFAGFGWGWHSWGYDWHGGGRVVYNHNTYISHSRTIVNRNNFSSNRSNFNHGNVNHANFNRGADSHGGGVGGHSGFNSGHSTAGMHSGAFSGFDHGGTARGNSFRGGSSFGGSHGGGGFHGGGGGHGGGGHGGGGHR